MNNLKNLNNKNKQFLKCQVFILVAQSGFKSFS